MPCSLVQLAHVVVCVRVLVDVVGVMVIVLIGRHTVDVEGAVLVAIFVVNFLYLEMYSLHHLVGAPLAVLSCLALKVSIFRELIQVRVAIFFNRVVLVHYDL